MTRISIWIDWFFYNSSALWTALLLATLLVTLSSAANHKNLFFIGMIIAGLSLLALLVLGIVNLVQAPHCCSCRQILPVGWEIPLCQECSIHMLIACVMRVM